MYSQTAEYALRAMACLALRPNVLVSTNVLARETKVPSNYLSKVLQTLANAGLIEGRASPGRVMLLRDNGKLIWMNLRDHTGDLQIAVSQRDCAEPGFPSPSSTTWATSSSPSGPLMKTKTGEITALGQRCSPRQVPRAPAREARGAAGRRAALPPALRRHVGQPRDLASSSCARASCRRIRRHLMQRGYLEVETPMLQTLAGGAAARPSSPT
jgi:lysyl-tRNA synthetase class 2